MMRQHFYAIDSYLPWNIVVEKNKINESGVSIQWLQYYFTNGRCPWFPQCWHCLEGTVDTCPISHKKLNNYKVRIT